MKEFAAEEKLEIVQSERVASAGGILTSGIILSIALLAIFGWQF